jgi:hypothetical protein
LENNSRDGYEVFNLDFHKAKSQLISPDRRFHGEAPCPQAGLPGNEISFLNTLPYLPMPLWGDTAFASQFLRRNAQPLGG